MLSLRRRALLAAAVAVPTLVGGWALQERSTRDGARLFDQVLTIVADRFVDTVDTAALYQKAAMGLVEQLDDPYSELFTPQQSRRFSTNSTGRYGGIGMSIEKQAENVVVVRVFPNTPAERAGVVEGDRIIGVDTASARDWSTDQVSTALTGTPGTKVRVRFARPGVPQPIDHVLTRAIINVPAVLYAMLLDGGVGYVFLQQFNENASDELSAAIDRLSKRGAKGIILDLRWNPGGILDQSLSVSNLFLKDGQEIASVRARQGKVQRFMTQRGQHYGTLPLVVMVNGGSASASEIVAGALQDHDRALVVGTTSYGKGLVQSVFPLEGGYSLKLTTAKWFTPSGRSIQNDRDEADPRIASLGGPAAAPVADEAPDSLETEAVKKDRPVFRSDAGRIVYGGGGITPDVIVPEDTIPTAQQELYRALSPKIGIVRAIEYDMSVERKGKVTPEVRATPEWREEFFSRLTQAGVNVDRRLFDSGAPLIDRWLTNQVLRQSFGDSAAFRRRVPEDPQLQRALALLQRGQTQKDLFALAQAPSDAPRRP
ncbi:MAG: S41 family peptidase [Gemmatimonadota bacterium]|nr:S41 family peptidase [Gemmatimonadota bacterium]